MTYKSLEFGPDLREYSKCDVKGSRTCFSERKFLCFSYSLALTVRKKKKIFVRYMGYHRCAEGEQGLHEQVVQSS